MKKKRVLITGISGLLGSNVAHCLKDRYDILGLYHNRSVLITGVETRSADLRYSMHTRSIVQQFNPDVVIHCAAVANVDACEQFPELARDINVQGTANLVSILEGTHAKIIYVSTDLVYDGIKGLFKETDSTGPRNQYARTKLEGEQCVLSRPNSVVLRTNFFGWNLFEKRSLAQWVIEELNAGHSVKGFTDAIFSSIYTFDLAELIHAVIVKDIAGIYNCASSTFMSKYDFLVDVAQQAGFDPSLIKPVSILDGSLKAMRSKNLSMDVSKITKDLGVTPPSMETCIRHYIDGIAHDYARTIGIAPQKGRYYPFQDTIPYGRQCLEDDDIKAVVDVMHAGNLTQGPKIEAFERALVECTGASFCAAVNSGTSALHVACLAAGVGPGDEVITTTNTFVASANCAIYCQATPVLADIDPRTYNISLQDIESRITAKTAAVIPVHFAGQSCDMETIHTIVKKAEKKFNKKIFIIEDASHALGSLYKNKKVGDCTYSDMVIMSFHPVKHITMGEGGAILTNDQSLHRKFCYLRSHGITNYPDELIHKDEAFEVSSTARNPWYYEQQWLGYNYRITDLQCALGVTQLRKLPEFVKRRREIVVLYHRLLQDIPGMTLPFESANANTNFHLFVILIDFEKFRLSRADVMNALRHQGIYTQVHYIPVHTHPYYQKNFKTQWGDYPCAESYYRRCLSMPLSPAMSDDDVHRVANALKESLLVAT